MLSAPRRWASPGNCRDWLWRCDEEAGRRRCSMLEVRDVTVTFGGVKPLDGVSFEFPGGVCGLVGPNGAGKTTFFNLVSGFVRPSAGDVLADGESLLSMAPYRRARWGLRRTFQQEQVVHALSAYDNVRVAADEFGGSDGSGVSAAL